MSILIELDVRYRIISDSRQYSLQKYVGIDNKTGESKYRPVAFSQEPTHLVKEYASRFTRESTASSLLELVSTYQSTVKRLETLLESFKLKP